ncbi:MAG: hypothetical protein H7Z72_13295 [Bacteroidetes bacterium]|nr:hypothetical protein [Fibrella sp.]
MPLIDSETMGERAKTLVVLERIKAIAISCVGFATVGQGITYFFPQLKYDVPVALYPAYQLLGPVALAVGMLVLGAVSLNWGYKAWQNSNGSMRQLGVIWAGLFVVIGGVFYATHDNKGRQISPKSSSSPTAALAYESIDPGEFKNEQVSNCVTEFKDHYAAIEQSLAKKDRKTFRKTSDKLGLWFTKASQLTTKLATDERTEFSYFIISAGKKWTEWSEKGQDLTE